MSEAEAVVRQGYSAVQLGPKVLEIPREWEFRALSEVVEINPSYDRPNGDKLDFVPMDAVNEENRTIEYTTTRAKEDCTNTWFKNGDTIYAKITPCAENGKIAFVDSLETEVGSGSTEFVVLSPDTDIVDPKFVFYLANLPHFRSVTISLMEGSTARQRIPTNAFYSIRVPVPPLPEQRRITDILSTVDEQIRQTDKIIEETKELKRGLTRELLTQGISHSEYQTAHFGPIGVEIPAGWDVVPLKSVTKDITDGVHSTPDYVDDGIPFLSTKNVNPFQESFNTKSYEKYVTEEDHKNMTGKIKPEKGDLIIARRATIGPTQLVRVDSEFSIFVGLGLIKPTNKIDGRFLEQFLNWDRIQSVLNLKSPGSTMKTLNLSTLRTQVVPLPPLNEQQKIADVLGTVDKKIQKEQDTKMRLQELKRGLMQDLLTGKVRVNDISLEEN